MDDYRHAPRRCPHCRELMEPRQATAAVFDVCPDCFGVWVDWMDGDLRGVEGQLGSLPHSPHQTPTGQALVCPECRSELYDERFGPAGASIHRCGTCAGTFVPRASLELLDAQSGREPERGDGPWLSRVMDALWQAVAGPRAKIMR